MAIDAGTIITMLASGISAVFGILMRMQQGRIQKLEADNEVLEEENKNYVAIFMMLSVNDEESLRKARERASKILRGDRRVELD